MRSADRAAAVNTSFPPGFNRHQKIRFLLVELMQVSERINVMGAQIRLINGAAFPQQSPSSGSANFLGLGATIYKGEFAIMTLNDRFKTGH
jgi:hypothetical protein